jgi:hypothetical protein
MILQIIVNFMSTGAWSIEIDHDLFAHVNSIRLLILQIHRVNFMSTGAWSIEIDHDPSPMLIQWGYDPSNYVNFMSTGAGH